MEELRKSSLYSMEAFVRQEFVSHPVQSVILEGDPAQLIEFARKKGMKLIMMPTWLRPVPAFFDRVHHRQSAP